MSRRYACKAKGDTETCQRTTGATGGDLRTMQGWSPPGALLNARWPWSARSAIHMRSTLRTLQRRACGGRQNSSLPHLSVNMHTLQLLPLDAHRYKRY